MGNQLAQPQRLQPEHLAELPNLVLKDTIGGGRFLKTLLCVPDEGGLVVVKVYHKRGEVPDLRPYEQRLYEIRRALANIPLSHVWPFQHFYQTDKACYLIRQHIFSNLYHRLSTRPFLSHTEKLWIAFQLLHGLAQIQAHGICHGDIKCENVLVTSWNWAYLTDFASYKPTRLPADNPADFSFFFDTGGRRRCYIAPERFYNSSVVDAAKLPALPLQPSMDVFSLGCVFAELFLEGKALFDLSKLLAYQRGDYDPAAMLAPVDPEVRSLILNMIQRNPEDRLLAADYLQQWGPKLFPPSFEAFLHPFYQSLLPLDADARIAAVSSGGDQESRMLLATLLCTLLRGAKLPESKVRAMAMLADAAGACGDDTRLQRLVPYLLAMVSEPVAGVRAAALRCLARVLASVEVVPPSDSKIFNEYILPSLSLVPNDQEEMVRIEYAGVTAQLATVAQRFLTRLHQVASTAQNPASAVPVRYDEEMAALRMAVEQVVHELVVGTRSTSWTRLALLPHVPALAAFLGRRESNDFLLPAMITFLNDRSWQLRAAFFTHIAALGPYAGADGLDAFLLPCLEQALADAEEAVICQAVGFLTSACQTKQLRKRSLLAAVAKVAPLLLEHPAPHVRASAVAFVAAAAASLSPAEPAAPLYSIHVDSQVLHSGASYLTAIMDSLDGAAADQAAQPPGSTRSSGSADAGAAADSGQFSASAVTVPSPGKLRQRATGRLLAHASRVAGKADMGGSRLASAMHASSPFGSDDDTLSLSPRMLSERSGQTLTSPLGGAQTGSSGVGTAAVSDALAAAMATDLPAHAGSSAFRSAAAAPWHPRGVLIAHLAEHRRAVNQLAVAANGSFFASASSDETVKVWDCRRLEKDVSFRSRLTYTGQGGRILACTACQDAQSVASGSSNGSVHVWRVETVRAGNGAADRYTGIVGQRQMAVSEGAVLEVMQWASLLLYVTQRGGVHAWDLRMDRDAWTLPCTPSQGFLEKLVTESEGANWLVTGSSRGQLSLWDMRFRICVNSWQHPQRCAIDALAPALAGPARLGVPSAPANCPLVYVAAGPHEVGLWDVEEGKCHQVLRVLQHDNAELVRPELPAALRKAPNPPAASALDPAALTRHLAIQELQVPQGRATGCRTLLPTGAGPLLSAGSDCCIRLWDAALPEHSYMVCGPPMSVSRDPSAPPDKPPPDATSSLAYIYSQRSVQNVSLVEESSIVRNTDVGHHESLLHSPLDRAAALCHQDGITHMTSLEMSDRILLSCSQDGVVKAWK
ncbi:hypothetical protein WJX72_010933 [[Myrmecia] bisecta]|uniref:non-specific serine/threonine protein kinase n=1 Tax=[Myrmecia] bisecta TaxID=41462 RepID=A0AAW1Q9X8_9CHLO